ncbi:hypothetical protein Pla175_10390 [Pirellulimonas nuda]|uniref:Uncharacterized protein n=1 Tax=Pirellulimonas nuda TaxID=2528009 RepID=A0A518D892_9BACT|nr:hypothetical protein [Pirellulimonas nuda]QDU87673.1 hypothetical protein Pla175_10390 [Pirellulimonas nuda]
MAAIGKLGYYRLAFFSKPREDRALYRLVKKTSARGIVEIGMGTLGRAVNLVRVAQRYSPGEKIAYTGLDAFDERSSGQPQIRLIDAHRALKATGASVRLMPGGPAGVPAVANALMGTDLLVIGPDATDAELAPVWFYVPRMRHEGTVVLRASRDPEQPAVVHWRKIRAEELESLAGTTRRAA